MEKYRIRFSKDGTAKFLSHLDLLRIFTRCGRRTGLDIVYSQGFNPHAELVFSAPLPLGMTSDAEYADICLGSETDERMLLETLQSSLPEGIRPLKIKRIAQGEPSVMKPVAFARYALVVRFEESSFREIFPGEAKRCLESGEPVFTAKKSKSGTKTVDVRPMILKFCENSDRIGDDRLAFEAVLAAGNENNLRPEVAMKGIFDRIAGIDALKGGCETEKRGSGPAEAYEILSVRKIEFLDGEKMPLW